ncbi:VanZ family protein [Brachybacterium hainanense]|uniref:VanZ family protein n=1 Tax=Brachybacterium hainanense TaxID=1541174 RepID=A0ABV6R9E8_9MICO
MRPLVTPARLLVLGLAVVLNIGFYLPSVPKPPGGGSWMPNLDKIVHILVFALTVWALGRILAPRRRFPIGWVVVGAIGHAALIEIVQGLAFDERSMSADDVLADVLGIGLGVLAWWVERRRLLLREPRGVAADEETR